MTGSPILTAVGLSLLALAPFVLITTTAFAKISVVLSLLRSALGTQNVPPNPVLASLALVLAAFVMAPVASQTVAAAGPALARVTAPDDAGPLDAATLFADVAAAGAPLHAFLVANAGDAELATFHRIRSGDDTVLDLDAVPWSVAVPAFAITELAEAFQIGFLLFLPFLVLDLLVGSVLLSLGMHMLTPTSVSMPFKLLLFVAVNGWLLLSESLVLGYTIPGAGP